MPMTGPTRAHAILQTSLPLALAGNKHAVRTVGKVVDHLRHKLGWTYKTIFIFAQAARAPELLSDGDWDDLMQEVDALEASDA